MATTVGHALCGVDCLLMLRAWKPRVFNQTTWVGLAIVAIIANFPDLDIAVSALISDNHLKYHGLYTHMPGYMLIFAALLALITQHRLASKAAVAAFGSRLSYGDGFLLFALPLLSHAVLDFLTGPNRGFFTSYGTPILGPIIESRLQAPLTLFLGPHHDSMERFIDWYNVWVVCSEVLIFGPLTGLLFIFSRKMSKL